MLFYVFTDSMVMVLVVVCPLQNYPMDYEEKILLRKILLRPSLITKKRIFMNDCDESISCSYYEGEGFLSTAGCDTVAVTPEYVDCACDHYSNFGLLFQSCDSETWTIWRILSLALLAFFWFVLISLFSLTLFSPRFRRRTGLESRAEKRQRILGERTGVRNLEDD
mmetsp:Transcript_32830/g.51315  ORF Transcript_32830/g.51315 Transcript_32830/m.51315 type:complete len:166 (-) Transcript_32830:78-575(-)